MTKLWLDTEFNGFGGEFISAALVAEDGSEWYQAVSCNTPVPWVAENVIPVMGIKPKSITALQASLRKYPKKFETITIIADWPTDIERFCRLLSIQSNDGRIIITPPITFVLKPWLNGMFKSEVAHNALEDAKAIMRRDITTGIN